MAELGPDLSAEIKYKLKSMATSELAAVLSTAALAAYRRDLVGGLIRYLKDGKTDLGDLLFHYVHIEDYGQAMVEGWGDLHALLTPPKTAELGALGLPYTELGELAQAICSAITERGEHTREEIVNQIAKVDFDESDWWDRHGGDILDDFEEWIGLNDEEIP